MDSTNSSANIDRVVDCRNIVAAYFKHWKRLLRTVERIRMKRRRRVLELKRPRKCIPWKADPSKVESLPRDRAAIKVQRDQSVIQKSSILATQEAADRFEDAYRTACKWAAERGNVGIRCIEAIIEYRDDVETGLAHKALSQMDEAGEFIALMAFMRKHHARETDELNYLNAELLPLGCSPRNVASPSSIVISSSKSVQPNQNDDKSTTVDELRRCEKKALYAYNVAEQRNDRELTDIEAHRWLKEHIAASDHGDESDYNLPSFDTWSRYLRQARRKLGQSKYHRQADRTSGRSIVKANQID